MKVYCKRTYFNHGEDEEKWGYVRWKKDCWYEFQKADGFESKYIFGHINTNKIESYSISISKTDFDKYFYLLILLEYKSIYQNLF